MTIINLDGIVGWDIEAKDINNQIDNATGDITFELNSGGGYITDGVSILNKIRSYTNGKTISKISYAGSMMTQIALACDEVQAYDNAIFFIHNAQGFAMGDNREMMDRAKHLENLNVMLSQLYIKKSGKKSKEIREMMDTDTFIFGEDIKTNGFADIIIDTDKEKDEALATNLAKELFKKSQKALKEEGLNSMELKEQVQLCENGCNILLAQTSSNELDKPNTNSKKGITVNKQEEALQALLDTANATIEANQVQIDGKDKEIENLTADLFTTQTAVASANEAKDMAIASATLHAEVTTLAFEMGVSKDVAANMLKQPTKDKAEIVGLKAVQSPISNSTNATTSGEDTNTDSDSEKALSKENAEAMAQAIADNL